MKLDRKDKMKEGRKGGNIKEVKRKMKGRKERGSCGVKKVDMNKQGKKGGKIKKINKEMKGRKEKG